MNPLTLATSLIKPFESLKLEAYLDPIGIPTIGYGTTVWSAGDKVQMGEKIDEDGAEQELWSHLADSAQAAINSVISVPLAPHQMAALLSFVHNIGGDAEAAWPTLRDLINDGAPTSAIADQWVKYKHAAGSPLLGLYRRRVAEVLVFHDWDPEAAFEAVQGIGFDTNWRTLIFDELEIPKRGETIDEIENERTADPTPETPVTTEDANYMQYAELGGEKTFEQFTGRVVRERKIVDVPKVDMTKPPKAAEDSKTVRGIAKEQAGKEMAIAGATTIGTVATVVPNIQIMTGYIDKHSTSAILTTLGIIGFVVLIYGGWRIYAGQQIKYEGRRDGEVAKV